MNILVSGVAGDIGFGVGRILKSWNWDGVLHGIDIKQEHAGLFVFDRCSIALRANDLNYFEWLSEYINKNHIKLFIPTSEAEIARITEEGIDSIAGAMIIKANALVIKKSLDKYECLNYLASFGIPVPEHGLVGKTQPKRYPVIIKPRSGQGSKGIVKIDNLEQLLEHFTQASEENLVWQEYLKPDDEEYTCPVFYSKDTGARILILRRQLQGGFSSIGEVIENNIIYQYVNSIIKALELDGVMNIQLRLTDNGPLLFEINPRLSSTLVFRDKMGFSDLKWLLAHRLGQAIPNYNSPSVGTRFYRGVQEYISPV